MSFDNLNLKKTPNLAFHSTENQPRIEGFNPNFPFPAPQNPQTNKVSTMAAIGRQLPLTSGLKAPRDRHWYLYEQRETSRRVIQKVNNTGVAGRRRKLDGPYRDGMSLHTSISTSMSSKIHMLPFRLQ